MPGTIDTAAKESKNKAALQLFQKIGLDERTAQNAVANAKVTTNLIDIINEAAVKDGCEKSVGNLLYSVATKFPVIALKHRPTLLQYVTSSKIKTVPQVEAAFGYLAIVGTDPLDIQELEKRSGVGVEVSPEQIKSAVEEVIKVNKEQILSERYRINVGNLLGQARQKLPWADGKLLKEEVDAQLNKVLGGKTAQDEEKPVKKKKEKPKVEEPTAPVTPSQAPETGENDPYSIFPRPEENYKVHTEIFFSDGTIWRPHNSREKLQKHLLATGGKVFTRFPPEPNGYLHIGHAKAMFVDFGFAKAALGECYLRYDDTNPEAEKQEYIDHIQEVVSWMGWKPYKITYSSDYFQELYELAVELIKRGKAYVDHQTADEIKEYREKQLDSPWRNRPVAESLKLFEDMKKGKLDEGEATLRMKQDNKNDNYNMYDLIAYRIKFTPHPHAGDKWCIYPSYDYTHCIVDSLENISHSLCTLEFESRRASYYWLLEALDLYLPYVWEYARLNITHTVLSKRKLNTLVTQKWVNGWDDPRLMTLAGLRRRGASPEAMNAFCQGIGITRSDNVIRMELLEHFIRDDLNANAPRTMVVLRPLKVIVTNLSADVVQELEAKSWPNAEDGDPLNTYKIPFSRVLYIESSDFKLQDSKDYYGLAPGKSVLLRYAFPVRCTNVIYAEDNKSIVEIHVEYDSAKSTKPKGVIHWVAEPSPGVMPLQVEVRLIDKLFMSENPGELDDWPGDLNPSSMETIPQALAVPPLKKAAVGSKFQFERLGYFCVDPDSSDEKVVFNRTVTLRDSYAKVGIKK